MTIKVIDYNSLASAELVREDLHGKGTCTICGKQGKLYRFGWWKTDSSPIRWRDGGFCSRRCYHSQLNVR